MKKVFWKCTKPVNFSFREGKEYEVVDGFVVNECGGKVPSTALDEHCDFMTKYANVHGNFPPDFSRFVKIEREVFTAHGFERFKHTPGEPMPLSGELVINVLTFGGQHLKNRAENFDWGKGSGIIPIIGWRYADSERKEPAISGLNPQLAIRDEIPASNIDDCQISADTISIDAITTQTDCIEKQAPPITESDAADLFGFIHRSIAALNEPEPKAVVRCESSNLLIVAGDSVQLGGRFGGVS